MSTVFRKIRIAGGDTAKPLAMAKRLKVIERYLSPSAIRFLDCGCGSGAYVLALMERFGLDVHGIEINMDKVKAAWSNANLRQRVTCGDLQEIALPAGAWDYAMLNEVLEHVPDDRRALEEVYRILKPNGVSFIFSPNRWFPFETHGVHLKSSGQRVPHWIPLVPYIPLQLGNLFFDYWARNYWQGELAGMVEAAGFSIVERSFIWLTFEDISGRQPQFIKAMRPLMRLISEHLEKFPFVKRFGVSQVIVCKK
jgi:ubiquinone/menaquinone biosynthesis C-methylase UbiE